MDTSDDRSLYGMRSGETLRAILLFAWALWVGAFARFEQSPAVFEGFIALTSNEWVWASVFMGVAASVAVSARWLSVGWRLASGYAYVLAWGWIAGLFAGANWKSSAVPLTAGLAFYGAISCLRLFHLQDAQARNGNGG